MLTEETDEVGIVEIVVLHKRDGGLGAFDGFAFVDDFDLIADAPALNVFADHGIGTEVEGESDDEPHDHLPQNLVATGKSFLVFLEDLDVVVEKTDGTEPQGGANHEQGVDVAQTAEEEGGNEDGQDDDEATHRGNAHFVHSKGVDAGVASGLTDVAALHPFDEILAEPHGNDETENQCKERTEGNVDSTTQNRGSRIVRVHEKGNKA